MQTDDLPGIRARLERRAPLAMFPLANLEEFGLDGAHDYALSIWSDGDDILCRTRGGMLFPLISPGAVARAARVLDGMTVTGIIGAAAGARSRCIWTRRGHRTCPARHFLPQARVPRGFTSGLDFAGQETGPWCCSTAGRWPMGDVLGTGAARTSCGCMPGTALW